MLGLRSQRTAVWSETGRTRGLKTALGPNGSARPCNSRSSWLRSAISPGGSSYTIRREGVPTCGAAIAPPFSRPNMRGPRMTRNSSHATSVVSRLTTFSGFTSFDFRRNTVVPRGRTFRSAMLLPGIDRNMSAISWFGGVQEPSDLPAAAPLAALACTAAPLELRKCFPLLCRGPWRRAPAPVNARTAGAAACRTTQARTQNIAVSALLRPRCRRWRGRSSASHCSCWLASRPPKAGVCLGATMSMRMTTRLRPSFSAVPATKERSGAAMA
mmetsp:Transcript_84801/g.265357  ORF Transcript_84801/g.265357 Transcript_84801/m.265357 type:complete len:271 (-) Transcript_84801:2-814(-)